MQINTYTGGWMRTGIYMNMSMTGLSNRYRDEKQNSDG